MNPNPFNVAPVAAPAPRAAGQTPGTESVVDQNSEFNGRYQTNNNLRIEGRAQGEITCAGTLLIAEQGKVNATVKAANITIAGEYEGDVACEGRFVLLPSARARGRVQAGSLIIQEGAVFSGEIRMQDPLAPAAPALVPTPARSTGRGSRGERSNGLPVLGADETARPARSEAASEAASQQ